MALELSEKDCAALSAADDKNYVATVQADIVRKFPALADDAMLTDRLNTAYAKARELGFAHDVPIREFLELEANAPGFYNKPAVNTLLRWTDVPVEDSFEMLLDVVRWKQREEQEKK